MLFGWIYSKGLSVSDIAVYGLLGNFGTYSAETNTFQHCRPSRRRMAKILGCSVSTVARSLARLVEVGMVIAHVRHDDRGAQLPTEYEIVLSEFAAPTTSFVSPVAPPHVTGDTPPHVTGDTPPMSLVTHNQEAVDPKPKNPSSSGASYRDRIAALTGADDDGIDLVIEKIKSATKKPVRNLGALIRSISDQDIIDHHASLTPAPAASRVPSVHRACPVHPGSISWPCASCLGDLKAGEDPFAGCEDLRPDGWFEAHPLGERFRGGAVEPEPEPGDVWVSPVWDGDTEAFVTESNAGGDSVESTACSNPMCHDGYVYLGASGRRVCAVCGGKGSVGARSVASLVGSLADSFGSIA